MKAQSKRPDPPKNRSMPPGKIIPELVYANLDEAAAWLCQTFGFTERLRIGNHRAQLVLDGESIIAIGNPALSEAMENDSDPALSSRTVSHSIMVRIENVDQLFERAVNYGAKALEPPTDFPYGERQCTVEDIGGHIWTFSQSIADIDPHAWEG